MRALLDTNVVLWHLSGERRLSRAACHAIDQADDLLISAVSFAEIGVKIAVGKLQAPLDIAERIEDLGVRTLGLTPRHGMAVATLPLHHRDPFDRLLIAQAMAERLTVITSDTQFDAYPVATIRA